MINHPIFILTALMSAYIASIQTFESNKDIENNKRAKLINDKASKIKDLVAISNINNNNIISDESGTIIDSNKISHLVVPIIKNGREVEILLDRHFQATLAHFKNSTNTNKPSCNTLALTGIISETDCNYITSLNLEFYTYKNEQVEYQIPKELSKKTISLTENSTITEVDTKTDKIVNNDSFFESDFMEKKKYDLTFKYNKQIEKLVEKNKIESAKKLNEKLNQFNSYQSELNTNKYGW